MNLGSVGCGAVMATALTLAILSASGLNMPADIACFILFWVGAAVWMFGSAFTDAGGRGALNIAGRQTAIVRA